MWHSLKMTMAIQGHFNVKQAYFLMDENRIICETEWQPRLRIIFNVSIQNIHIIFNLVH